MKCIKRLKQFLKSNENEFESLMHAVKTEDNSIDIPILSSLCEQHRFMRTGNSAKKHRLKNLF